MLAHSPRQTASWMWNILSGSNGIWIQLAPISSSLHINRRASVFFSDRALLGTFIEPLRVRQGSLPSPLKQSESQLVKHTVCFDTHTSVLLFFGNKTATLCRKSSAKKKKNTKKAQPRLSFSPSGIQFAQVQATAMATLRPRKTDSHPQPVASASVPPIPVS